MALQDDLSSRVSKTGAKGILIDISALELVDSFVGRILAEIAAIAKLMDAETVVAGMRPAVAITLVELGVPLTGLKTALNMDQGMRVLREAVGANKETEDGRPRR
ncbi:MAG: STAS domain-containing protein [Bauldia sp.]